jgi:hypothetical protein
MSGSQLNIDIVENFHCIVDGSPSHHPILATERVTKCSQTRQKTRALILDRLPGGDDFHQRRSNHESRIDLLYTRPLASTHPHRRLLAYVHLSSKQTHIVPAYMLPPAEIHGHHLIYAGASHTPHDFPQLQPPEVAFQTDVGRLSQGRAS